GFDLQIKPGSVKVGPGQARAVTVEITLDGRVLQAGDYEGRIVATGGGTTLRAPLYVRVDNTTPFGSNAPELTVSESHDTDGSYRLDWTVVEDAKRYRLQEATTFINHLFDDAESDGSQWEPNGWTQVPLRSHSPTQSYFSGQGPELNTTLTSAQPIALPAGFEGTLSYWTFYSIEEGFDFGYVEVSADEGTTWRTVDQVTGLSDGWVKRSADLSAFEGRTVLIRFRYATDLLIDLGLFEGWYVDDISLDTADWATTVESSRTQHQVTDQPSGTYSYRVAALFNDRGFGRFLQGPWSNVVDVTVER
ncbi:MAG: hypothetical protein ACRDVM_03480, partial [Acidimicrobiia bacterium]